MKSKRKYMKRQITITEALLVIAVIIIAILCNTTHDIQCDKVEQLSAHDSTILINYELKHK